MAGKEFINMIKLNLLPEELRKKTNVIDMSGLKVVPIVLGIFAIMLIVHAAAYFGAKNNKNEIKRIKKQIKEYQPKIKEFESLKKLVDMANAKIKAIEELTKNRVLWSRALNGISDSMLDDIWLDSLSYEIKGNIPQMELEGIAKGTSSATVGKFINALENNKDFSKDFQKIKFESTKVDLYKNYEVMKFKLICLFREST